MSLTPSVFKKSKLLEKDSAPSNILAISIKPMLFQADKSSLNPTVRPNIPDMFLTLYTFQEFTEPLKSLAP